ncbi:MAG: Flp pilus assembly protein CpaB [Cyanobacteria bacterium NC_groundwater_1444_Ag_S-0.65um_54_12]|nr:Flp pilus assembly protein CpaB [Cyanobacteria bacterium NC_groundwater_1444_Ag_S-0.65um_54_12]
MLARWSRLLWAMAIGLGTSISFLFFLDRRQERGGATAEPLVPVLLVREYVPAGSRLLASQFMLAKRPTAYVPAGALSELASATGRIASSDLLAGELLLAGRLYPPDHDVAKASLPVPPGKRAVTVAVDEVIGVAGFVMPGSLVDVLGTMDIAGQATTQLLLQKIQVLAIAQDAKKKEDPEAKVVTSATLAVTPRQAQILILAADRGKIRLAMRGADESAAVNLSPITPAMLLGRSTSSTPRAVNRMPTRIMTRVGVSPVTIKPSAIHPTPFAMLLIRGTAAEWIQRDDH